MAVACPSQRGMVRVCLWAAGTVFLAAGTLTALAATAPEPADSARPFRDALQHLRPHPRLLLSDARLAALKQLQAGDHALAAAVKAALAQADQELAKPVPTYEAGPGAWATPGKHHIYALAFAYRWTGHAKYARKVEADLLAVAAFKDWNPGGSFLNTAEISHAVGVGYDWCFSAFSEDTRRTLRAGLTANGLTPYLDAYERKEWWTHTAFNWNQVCNGGTLLGVLGIAEDAPDVAARVLQHAVTALPLALQTYDEDGLWPEGLDYWQYATEYTVWALAGLDTALGTDFGLSDAQRFKGLAQTGQAVIFGAGPFRQYVNFADTLENKKRWALPYLFWLGARYGQPALAEAEYQAMQSWPALLDIVWYAPPAPGSNVWLPRDKLFRGSVELATFRSAWNDPNALFASLKAGYNAVNHGHLDLGVFELDALGVRWARDLGKDNYGLPGYFSDRQAGGKAWKIYRLRSGSHSVPLVDGQDQALAGRAHVVTFRGEEASPAPPKALLDPLAVVDFSSAYPAAGKALRGLRLLGGRRAVLVQDEFTLSAPRGLCWAMTTDAEIQVEKNTATLTLKGKRLKATLLAPTGAEFAQESTARQPPENRNAGVRRLVVPMREVQGAVCVAVLLAPEWPGQPEIAAPPLVPLADW